MSTIHSALESIARRGIPEETNLWPQIVARIERKDTVKMNPRLKLAWTVLLVLLGLILATTAAYALYRYFYDPGLQSVSDAGLIENVNATAVPTPLAYATSLWGQPKPAMRVGQTQTFQNVTMSLDWVYVEDGYQAFGFSTQGLTPDIRPGIPVVTYAGVTPEQYRGTTMVLDAAGHGVVVSYQLVRQGVVNSKVNIGIDLPLVQNGETLSTFHFDVANAPVDAIGGGGGNAYAVRVNGVEIRQEAIIVATDYVQARFCFLPPSAKDWHMDDVTLQFANKNGEPTGEPVQSESIVPFNGTTGESCADVTFASGNQSDHAMVKINIGALATTDEKLNGDWSFTTALSDLVNAPGTTGPTSTATPLASETIGTLSAMLDWAYADVNRLAFKMHFDGWETTYMVVGVLLRDANGVEINSSLGYNSAEADPSILTMDFEPMRALTGERFNGQLVITVSNDPVNYTPFAEYHFPLDLPLYPPIVLEPMQRVKVNGVELLLQMVKITPSFTQAYVCYNKPTSGDFTDWQLSYTRTALKIGNDETTLNTQMLIFDSDLGDVGKGPEPGWTPPVRTGRCTKIGFPVGHHDGPERLTLTIPELAISQPEVIPDADVKRAQQKLREQGIEFSYITVQGNGGGGSNWEAKKRPAGMSDEEVYRRFLEALGYFYPGPWVFTVEINP